MIIIIIIIMIIMMMMMMMMMMMIMMIIIIIIIIIMIIIVIIIMIIKIVIIMIIIIVIIIMIIIEIIITIIIIIIIIIMMIIIIIIIIVIIMITFIKQTTGMRGFLWISNLAVNYCFPLYFQYTLELTDGWYCIKSLADPAMVDLIRRGRIYVGQKLITCAAELVGSQDACSPLEVRSGENLNIEKPGISSY